MLFLVRFRLVILAGDTNPIEVICHMPLVCEEKGMPYCYTPSKEVGHTALPWLCTILDLMVCKESNLKAWVWFHVSRLTK